MTHFISYDVYATSPRALILSYDPRALIEIKDVQD